MKKLLLYLSFLLPMIAWAQDSQSHINFMGIELGQDSTVFAKQLMDKGFTPITADNGNWKGYKGDFWKLSNCEIVLKTNNEKVIDRVVVIAKESDYYLMSPLFKSLTSKYNAQDPSFIENKRDWFKCMWLAGAGVIEMNCMGSPINKFILTYYDAQAALDYLKTISSKLDDL